jgi:exopolysaccharide production protein ExoY
MDVRSGIAQHDFERPSATVSDGWARARREPLYRRVLKRCLDVSFVLMALPIVLPVILVLAAVLKVTGNAPFFTQERVGLGGRTFRLWKLRTMVPNAEERLQDYLRTDEAARREWDAYQKLSHDPRITEFGQFLRKSSLDELPQLWNVLIGDMSLVGPRPPIPSEVDKYAWWQRRRISVKPGLTCLWQVYGRNRVSFKRWVEMDLYYIDNWSLWLDIKLIAHTFRAVMRGTGM